MPVDRRAGSAFNAAETGLAVADRRKLIVWTLAIFVLKFLIDIVIIPHYKDLIGPFFGIGAPDKYDTIADSIATGHGYRVTPDTGLTLLREPGYPYLLAGLDRVFGDNGLQAAVVVNLLMSSISALILSKLALRVWPNRWAGLLAPLLFLLFPSIAVAELRAGVEMLFILVTLCFLLVLCRAVDERKFSWFAAAGLLLGLATLVRSTALLFPSMMVLYGLLFARPLSAFIRLMLQTAVLTVATLLVLSPWIVRNYLLVDKFIPTASVMGISMQVGYYICTHEDTGKGVSELEELAADERNELARSRGTRFFEDGYYQVFYDPRDEVAFNNDLAHATAQAWQRQPALFAKCTAQNLVNFWVTGRNRTSTMINVVMQLPYMILAALGVWLALGAADRRPTVLLLLYIAYSMAVCAPIHAIARYSVPLSPILAIFAAVPLAWLIARGSSGRAAAAAVRHGPGR